MDKAALRKISRLKRSELARAVPGFAAAAASAATGLTDLPPGVVAGYVPISSEADPGPLMAALQEAGHPLALPVIAAPNAPLVFRAWKDGDPLEAGAYGIPEPVAAAAKVRPAIVLVPLLAFDAQGFRLGYGGGYYDRTLSAFGPGEHGTEADEPEKILAIGIAYAGQEIAAVPRDEHDQRLDAIVTETGIRYF